MILTEFDEEKYKKALAKESEVSTTIRNVQSLMESMNISLEEAMTFLDIPKELQEKCRKMIDENIKL